ncbi:MAG: hypothetical protein JSU96_19380 [Acidobacteriota bacterium]|nr:MAG: hypothetical protein JSU96_19380 [Acidobacteriota bacterium]
MPQAPFEVTKELTGWSLFWAGLKLRSPDSWSSEQLREMVVQVSRDARDSYRIAALAQVPTVAALRKLFREAGCDPTRYRPSSEALLRRILKGGDIPQIHPLVDLNNCLSARLAVPCCVMTVGTFQAPFVFRQGRAGEHYESLRGPFNLEKKPLLVDTLGPLDAPITGSERVKVTEETLEAWLVAYLPAAEVSGEEAQDLLSGYLGQAPVAELSFALTT